MSLNTVYLVFKNADFTEGRGPMVFVNAFSAEDLAEKYIMSNCGIMGTAQREEKLGNRHNVRWFNGYKLQTVPVLNNLLSKEEKVKIRSEITKLKKQIAECESLIQ